MYYHSRASAQLQLEMQKMSMELVSNLGVSHHQPLRSSTRGASLVKAPTFQNFFITNLHNPYFDTIITHCR